MFVCVCFCFFLLVVFKFGPGKRGRHSVSVIPIYERKASRSCVLWDGKWKIPTCSGPSRVPSWVHSFVGCWVKVFLWRSTSAGLCWTAKHTNFAIEEKPSLWGSRVFCQDFSDRCANLGICRGLNKCPSRHPPLTSEPVDCSVTVTRGPRGSYHDLV